MYPFYEKAVKAGITTICIHKGLLPPDYEKSFAGVWEYATAWDIGKAAKDWPQMNFVIYHSALRAVPSSCPTRPGRSSSRSGPHPLGQRPGRDPAEVRRHQRLCRARHLVRQLGRGASEVLRRAGRHAGQGPRRRPRALGHRHRVVRLAAMADRGDAPAGDPRGHAEEIRVRRRSATPTARPSRRSSACNAARLYRINVKAAENTPMPAYSEDRLAGAQEGVRVRGRAGPSNLRYGYVRAD